MNLREWRRGEREMGRGREGKMGRGDSKGEGEEEMGRRRERGQQREGGRGDSKGGEGGRDGDSKGEGGMGKGGKDGTAKGERDSKGKRGMGKGGGGRERRGMEKRRTSVRTWCCTKRRILTSDLWTCAGNVSCLGVEGEHASIGGCRLRKS